MIYLDNAATSWPKPEPVYDVVSDAIRRGGNPGRGSSEQSKAAATDVNEARAALARTRSTWDFRGCSRPVIT